MPASQSVRLSPFFFSAWSNLAAAGRSSGYELQFGSSTPSDYQNGSWTFSSLYGFYYLRAYDNTYGRERGQPNGGGQWTVETRYPSGNYHFRSYARFSYNFPVFLTFRASKAIVDGLLAPDSLVGNFVVSRDPSYAGNAKLRATILPFPCKYLDQINTGVANSNNQYWRSAGMSPNVIYDFASRIVASAGYNGVAEYVETTYNIDSSISTHWLTLYDANPYDVFETGNGSAHIAEHVKRLFTQPGEYDPILTVMLYPSDPAAIFRIYERELVNNADLTQMDNRLTAQFQTIQSGNPTVNTLPAVITAKQRTVNPDATEIAYSMGLGAMMNPRVYNNKYVTVAPDEWLAKYMRKRANFGADFIFDDAPDLNLLPYGNFLAFTASVPAGWQNDGASYAGSQVILQPQAANAFGRPPIPIPMEGLGPHRRTFLYGWNVVLTDSILPFSRTASFVHPTGETIPIGETSPDRYVFASSLLCQVGGGMIENDEEYVARVWVYIKSKSLSGDALRLSVVLPVQSTGSLEFMPVFYTGSGTGDSSADASTVGSWQQLWVKFKRRASDANTFARAYWEKEDQHGVDYFNAATGPVPPFTNAEPKQNYCVIKLDHMLRGNMEAVVCLAGIYKLDGRLVDVANPPSFGFQENNVLVNPEAHYFFSGRSGTPILQDNRNGVSIPASTHLGTELLTANAGVHYGVLAPANNPYNQLLFWAHRNNTQGGRGSRLAFNTGNFSLVNPTEGSIEFWYCLHTTHTKEGTVYFDLNPNVYPEEGAEPAIGGSTGYFNPALNTNHYENFRPFVPQSAPYQSDARNDWNRFGLSGYRRVNLDSLKHIFSIKSYHVDDLIFNGTGFGFFRRGRSLVLLIWEGADSKMPYPNTWTNTHNYTSGRLRFSKLEWQMPEECYRSAKNWLSENFHTNKNIPGWYKIKFVWGARQELYVNDRLVDFNTNAGLFNGPVPAPVGIGYDTPRETNFMPNGLFMGTVRLSATSEVVLSDNFAITDLAIYNRARHQTASISTAGSSFMWRGLNNIPVLSTGATSNFQDVTVGSATLTPYDEV